MKKHYMYLSNYAYSTYTQEYVALLCPFTEQK